MFKILKNVYFIAHLLESREALLKAQLWMLGFVMVMERLFLFGKNEAKECNTFALARKVARQTWQRIILDKSCLGFS